ncbi:MAG: sugar phosphate nucleotidyltransferase [Acidimicrobiales bacterium]
MRAVVLVGGEGTRLRPLTLDVPKQMLAVVEQRMIERVLAKLAVHGVEEAVLSLGYRPDAFATAFPEGQACGVNLVYAVDPEPLDTAGAIRFAATQAGISETFLVVNGDVLTDFDLGKLFDLHRDREAGATIHLTPVVDPSAYGVVPTAADGRVLDFVEKPAPGSAPTNLINAGAYVMEPEILDAIPAGRRVSVERETFPSLVSQGRLFGLASGDYWIDAGTPATYLRACLDLVGGVRPGAPAPGARLAAAEGPWLVGSPVLEGRVEPGSLVADAAYVAKGAKVSRSVVETGARVEEGAMVAGSVLLAGAVVAARSVVDGSIVGEGAWIGPDTTIGAGSVVGHRVKIEAGSMVQGERVPA